MGDVIIQKYTSRLTRLKMNSKPLINLLTDMAKDYILYAPRIVQVIENHLSVVGPDLKLPVLYLIDSIIKNVRRDYVELFTQNIVTTFYGVFEKADENTRKLLWKLRKTWTAYFSHEKLHVIDLRCHEIDPEWKIQVQPSRTGIIHVNPIFLKTSPEVKPPTETLLNREQILLQASEVMTAKVSSSEIDSSASEAEMRAQLLVKQKEYLELQAKKVELELLQTKLQLEEKVLTQKEEETKLDIIAKQDDFQFFRVSERGKNRAEKIRQKQPSGESLAAMSLSSKSHRESHSSLTHKLAKKTLAEVSDSFVDGSLSKKSVSSRERHKSKEKEAGHRLGGLAGHRQCENEGLIESSKDLERDCRIKSVSENDGSWKGCIEAKKVSQTKRSYGKEVGMEQANDDDRMPYTMSSTRKEEQGCHDLVKQVASKSPPSSNRTDKNSVSPAASSPSKRKLSKDNIVDSLHRPKDKEDQLEKNNKMPSDLRLRGQMERGEVGLRLVDPLDIELRTAGMDDTRTKPPVKKLKTRSRATFEGLFGRRDVELRTSLACFTHVKDKAEADNENAIMERDCKILGSPGPRSPTYSVVSSTSGACDDLERPLINNRLPNYLEERKRILVNPQNCIDTMGKFKRRHIDNTNFGSGILQDGDKTSKLLEAKDLLDLEQHTAVMKQGVHAGDVSAMKGVQQVKTLLQTPSISICPNPWIIGTGTSDNNSWNSFAPAAAAGICDGFPVRLRGEDRLWNSTNCTPWMPAALSAAPAGRNPFEEGIFRPQVDNLIPKASIEGLRMAEQYIGRIIHIDKTIRQIRFYGDSAIVMTGMNGDEPRDIKFQVDSYPKTLLINGKRMQIYLGETKRFVLDQVTHTIRIGLPGRELCIDDKRYELFFGGRPINVFIDGRRHSFQFLYPPPRVVMGGAPRYDLCAGKVNLTLDTITSVSVFLDEKPQKIDVSGEPVIFHFSGGFKSVTLNGRSFPISFGAWLPLSFTLPNSEKHYLIFNSVSPRSQRAMQIFINANYGGEWNRNMNNAHNGGSGGRGSLRGRRDVPMDIKTLIPNPWTLTSSPESIANHNPFEFFSGLPGTNLARNKKEDMESSEEVKPVEAGKNVNVSDLVANLIKFGLIPSSGTHEKAPREENEKVLGEENEKVPGEENEKKERAYKPHLPTMDVSFYDNLKERRDTIIAQISTGAQCSQCGLRLLPDQTPGYSKHLDWHFRQNRREKANARKVLCRKWYLNLSDWSQFEETKDLEEAAGRFEHSDTVLASSHESAICPQCGEKFESYFDEEREEWRLKNAKNDEYEGEERLFHVICHKDHLRSLAEESLIQEDGSSDSKEVAPHTPASKHEDEVLIIKEGKQEIVIMDIVDLEGDDGNEDKRSADKNVYIGSKENYNAEKDSSLDYNDTRIFTPSIPVQSAIMSGEDSTFIPGFCDNAEAGVFSYALDSESQKSVDRSGPEEKKIIYEPMKFNIPPIKLEPLDEEQVQSSGDKSLGCTEPMNIDLSVKDSTVTADSRANLTAQIRTLIDGNLQDVDAPVMPFMPVPKIQINLSAIGNLPMPSHTQKKKVDHVCMNESTASQDQTLVNDGSSKIYESNNTEINLVLTEEMKRLKPRFVGTKLANCPPRFKGKQQIGICLIC